MSIFEKARWKVFSPVQHPLKHSLSDFIYANPLAPAAANVQQALDYIFAVLYPNYIGTFATTAALPVSSAANDYAFVTDDGDGKSAGYVWQVIDAAGKWVKRYDVDWSLESILAETINRTQYQYAMKFGMQDLDPATGAVYGAALAGQHIFGGVLDAEHLTLHANSGAGASTGFIQMADSVRPTADGTLSLGTTGARWLSMFTGSLTAGTLTASGGSLTDSSGQISLGATNLLTTGTITGTTGYFTSSLEVGPLAGNALVLAPGSLTDESGSLAITSTLLRLSDVGFDFSNGSGTGLSLASGNLTITSGGTRVGYVDDATENIYLGGASTAKNPVNADLSRLTVDAGALTITLTLLNSVGGTGIESYSQDSGYATWFQMSSDTPDQAAQFATQRVRGTATAPTSLLSGDVLGRFEFWGWDASNPWWGHRAEIAITAAEDFLGAGNGVDLSLSITKIGAMARSELLRLDSDGKVYVPDPGGIVVGTLTLAGTDLGTSSGDLRLAPAGLLVVTKGPQPAADNTLDLGTSVARFNDLFMGGTISDGTNSIAIANLLTFRAANGTAVGDSLFWDGSKWVASAPDTEIVHSAISGLTTGDAGHTQFAMLAGRSGGQTLQGGTGASELLVLESTSNVTKGTVQVKQSLLPFTTASYSGGWSGTDLGSSTNAYRDLYTKGEAKGLRFENLAAPANSAQNVGRVIYDGGVTKVDSGAAWIALIDNTNAQSVAGVKTFTSNLLATAKVGIGTGPITPNVELDVLGALATRRSDVASASSIASLATTTSYVKITGALATSVLGVASGFDGKRVVVHNTSSGSLTIKHQDAGASAADRVITPTGSDLVVLTNRSTELIYDSAQSRWVVASSGAGGGSYTTTAVQNVGASGTISSTTYDGFQLRRVQGSGGAQAASSTPFGTGGGWSDGTAITLLGQSDLNTLTILNNDAAKGCILDGDAVLKNNSILTLIYDSTADRWVEMYRANC